MSNIDDFSVWMKILRYLNRYDAVSGSKISQDLNITNSHCIKLLGLLSDSKFVSFKFEGRSKFFTLTVKGREEAVHIDWIMSKHNIPVVVQRDGVL